MRHHPFYRHPGIKVFYKKQLQRIEPTARDMERKYDETFGKNVHERDYVIDRLLGVHIPRNEWTQMPQRKLPAGARVDRRYNRDKDFIYVKSHYHGVYYRAQLLRYSPGPVKHHDNIVYTDFDEHSMLLPFLGRR